MDGSRRDVWIRGVRMASYEVGPAHGDQVVVVPGLCVASYLWPACDALAGKGFHVELVEPPGWPRSGRPRPEPADLAALAAYVEDWLDRRGLTDVLLVGQSVGAQLAAHVAAHATDRVRALILQGPVFDPALRTVSRSLGRWLLDFPRERPGLAAREIPEWLRVGPRRVALVLRQSLRDRLEETLAAVRVPVTVVVGEHDTLSHEPWQASLTRPPAPAVVMPGVGHSAPHASPEAFASLVADEFR